MVANRFRYLWLLLLLIAGLGLMACGGGVSTPGVETSGGEIGSSTDDPAPVPNEQELAALSGDILVDGSSTVYPITQAAAEEFQRYTPDVRTTVGVSGTGGGFERFCAGETDISNASRPIKEEEIENCKQNGIEYIELPVAYDGLAVLANPANDWVDCLTVDELKKIWEPAAQGKIKNWNQVRAGFPDRPLHLYGPGTDSGTFDYFTDEIVGEEGASRGDFTPSEDDNVLVQGISGEENALGYFGYAYYQANQEEMKLLAVDNGDGKCVQPSIETVRTGTYKPLSRPLFIYVKKAATEKPQVKAFVDFLLSASFIPLVQSPEVGYIALSDELYEGIAQRFAAGTAGSEYGEGSKDEATLEERYLQGK